MQTKQEKGRLVVDSKVFRDLAEPVISAGGEILRYFLNAENLTLSDTGFIKRHGDDPQAMISHAHELEQEQPRFRKVIDDLAAMVDPLLSQNRRYFGVGGGQRRDWIFSGLVARRLKIPHFVLFKDGRVEMYDIIGSKMTGTYGSHDAVLVSDLMTKGSSAYDVNANPPTGWIVNLRRVGVTVQNYVVAIDRLQGGRAALEQAGVRLHAWFEADDDFLQRHSSHPEEAIASRRNDTKFTRDYLAIGELGCLVRFFDPDGKIDHGRKFIRSHGDYLREIGRFEDLNRLVAATYGKGIEELIGRK